MMMNAMASCKSGLMDSMDECMRWPLWKVTSPFGICLWVVDNVKSAQWIDMKEVSEGTGVPT